MKELSIEEKAKAYDEAIEKAQKWYDINTNEGYRSIFENIFPELKESEDERIRKDCIKYLDWEYQHCPLDEDRMKIEKCITWLEKQGEQKTVDKVEPKFKTGDWVVCKNGSHRVFQVIELSWPNAKYLDEKGAGGFLNVFTLDKQYRPWTIQDAKEGDVLLTKECEEPKIVFILKGKVPKNCVCGYYCYYNIMYPHFATDKEKGCLAPECEDLIPASKEQRELLFQKMKEAGYEWDAEHKQLKKIEQKLAWSEEDIELLDNTIKFIEDRVAATSPSLRTYSPTLTGKEIPFLKSLKDRVQPHLKQEWSEEDEKQARQIERIVHDDGCTQKLQKQIADWFKSLKDRYTWKPSDEQIIELRHVISGCSYDIESLVELETKLKEL